MKMWNVLTDFKLNFLIIQLLVLDLSLGFLCVSSEFLCVWWSFGGGLAVFISFNAGCPLKTRSSFFMLKLNFSNIIINELFIFAS